MCPHCGLAMRQRFARDGTRRGWNCNPCAAVRMKKNMTPERRKAAGLWAYYRMGMDDFVWLLERQGGACAACGATPEPRGRAWSGFVVDHDHSCCPAPKRSCGDCIRGLLCQHCNVALGMVNDSPDRLRRLAAYLESGYRYGQ